MVFGFNYTATSQYKKSSQDVRQFLIFYFLQKLNSYIIPKLESVKFSN